MANSRLVETKKYGRLPSEPSPLDLKTFGNLHDLADIVEPNCPVAPLGHDARGPDDVANPPPVDLDLSEGRVLAFANVGGALFQERPPDLLPRRGFERRVVDVEVDARVDGLVEGALTVGCEEQKRGVILQLLQETFGVGDVSEVCSLELFKQSLTYEKPSGCGWTTRRCAARGRCRTRR